MRKRIVLSLIFLLLGVFIYFFFDIGLMIKNNTIVSIIRNHLPDSCWTFGFFFISINFTKNLFKHDILINSLYVLLIALIYEALQITNMVRGTFDPIDIIVYIISIVIAGLVEKYIRRKENEKN